MLSKERFMSAREIVKKLENQYEIYVDRKTVMDDLMAIDMMIPLETKNGKQGGYRIMTFE
jgi:predicted DNA-binding transcriptional regulator YafY